MADIMKEEDEVEVKDQDIVIVEEKPEVKESDNHDDEDDSPVVKSEEGETDKEREAIRERRRLEKLDRKDRRDKAISRDKLEMDFLRKRNDELERRMSAQEQRAHQADLGNLDSQLQQAQKETKMAEQVIAKAIEQGNGADVTKALGYRDQAMERVRQLNYAKQQATQRPVQPAQQMDDMTMHYAKKFLDDNKWYDSQGRDEESAIVLAIDQSLAKDGFDPKTEEYWDELKSRAARRLPERFTSSKTSETKERTPRGGPTVGSGREHAPTSTRQEVYLSPDRKQALIDAGVWDDPVLRVKYAKRYAEYDRTHS